MEVNRSLQAMISVFCVIVILLGANYARGREVVRHTDLQALYNQVNRNSFQGALPPATIEWSDIPDAYGRTIIYVDGGVDIKVDRASV